ncbi:unnamed protein product [Ostreobium quekettii]|uniref:Methyltransferase n=1 Tax=Ostreobium quekettii TaxID=121088 RepID=A0A8S1J2U4_9CHLO|nr:unnamed protein product [Ostreobium quekettii]
MQKQHASEAGNGSSTTQAPEDKAPKEAVAGSQPDPRAIMQIGLGFMSSRVLQVAVGLELFTVLGDGSMTAEQLGDALELHPRGTYDFFDTLVALKLLDRDGDGAEGRYKNTPSTAVFLDKKSPQYIGSMLEMVNAKLYNDWSNLEAGLKTGQPQTRKGGSVYDELGSTSDSLARYLDAIDSIQAGNFLQFAAKFDPQGYKTVTDAGCGSALFAVIVGRQHPQLSFNAFDLPSVTPETQRRIDAASMTDRVTVHSGDFFVDDLPKADVVFMGQVLHNWNLEKKLVLIRKAYDALPAGGAFVVIENVLDDARRENTVGLLVSLLMILEFGDGFDFTGEEFKGWCSKVGFRRFDTIPLGGPSSALVAYK